MRYVYKTVEAGRSYTSNVMDWAKVRDYARYKIDSDFSDMLSDFRMYDSRTEGGLNDYKLGLTSDFHAALDLLDNPYTGNNRAFRAHICGKTYSIEAV